MYSLILLGFASLLLSLFLTPVVRNLFGHLGVLDYPDKDRKLHARPIPRMGGIVIALSYLGAFGILLLSPLKASTLVMLHLPFVWRLMPAAGLAFFTGLLDDVVGLRPWQKMAGQSAAALLAFSAGVRLHAVGGAQVGEIWWSLPLTVLWLMVCTNALNLIDGVDGLAAGVGLFATGTTIVAALAQHNIALALVTIPLAGSLFGFLRFNFAPACIFMGDGGTFLVGFLLGVFGLVWNEKSATLLGMTAPLMALALPLLDTGISIVRRFLRRQPIMKADRGHIHHRLLDRGMTQRKAVLLLYLFCALAAVFSLLENAVHLKFQALVVVLFCVGTCIGIQQLGYIEFSVASNMLFRGAFRRVLTSQIAVQSFRAKLASTTDPAECWLVISQACRHFGFSVQLEIGGHRYVNDTGDETLSDQWSMRIPLRNGDYLRLAREFEVENDLMMLLPFIEALRSELLLKHATFAQHSFHSQRAIPSRVAESESHVASVAAGA